MPQQSVVSAQGGMRIEKSRISIPNKKPECKRFPILSKFSGVGTPNMGVPSLVMISESSLLRHQVGGPFKVTKWMVSSVFSENRSGSCHVLDCTITNDYNY
jgi:hypothetical protein